MSTVHYLFLPCSLFDASHVRHVERLVLPVGQRGGDAGALHLVRGALCQPGDEVLELVRLRHRDVLGVSESNRKMTSQLSEKEEETNLLQAKQSSFFSAS